MTIAVRIRRWINRVIQRIDEACEDVKEKSEQERRNNAHRRGFNLGVRATKRWHRRRSAAQAKGLPFNEPSPIEILGEMAGIDRGLAWAERKAETKSTGQSFAEPPPQAHGQSNGLFFDCPEYLAGETRGIAKAIAWFQRKEQAQANGIPFNEPQPAAPPLD